jgi:hypothetical protein
MGVASTRMYGQASEDEACIMCISFEAICATLVYHFGNMLELVGLDWIYPFFYGGLLSYTLLKHSHRENIGLI